MNRFITIEGGEGAGKSTVIQFIENYLLKLNFEVIVTREPGGSFLGEEIRELVLHRRKGEPIGKMAELFLFLAARAQHIKTLIHPALDNEKIVVCDRFNDSTIAYQSGARGLDRELVKKLCTIASLQVEPSLTIYLDIDPKIGIRRALLRNGIKQQSIDRIEEESIHFHENVRNGFLEIAQNNPNRVKVIDAQKSLDWVQNQAKAIIDTWIQSFHTSKKSCPKD